MGSFWAPWVHGPYQILKETYQFLKETYPILRETYPILKETYQILKESYQIHGSMGPPFHFYPRAKLGIWHFHIWSSGQLLVSLGFLDFLDT